MKKSAETDNFDRFIKILGEIGGYVSTILPYLLALLGKGSIPYATIVATLTLMVSVVVLWRWRWPIITRRKTSRGKVKEATASRLVDYFRAGVADQFEMPLIQRRAEIVLLSIFALGAVSVGGFNSPVIAEEISGLHCLSENDGFRIIITNFDAEKHQFENDLANIMHLQTGKKFQVCRYNKDIQLADDAIEAGRKNAAKLVVWGNINNGQVNLYLNSIEWEMLNAIYNKLTINQGQEESVFLTENISAEILFFQGNVEEAQVNLNVALDTARQQEWVAKNPNLLAEGYLLLGLLHDPNYTPAENANEGRAIKEYTSAIDIVETWSLNLEGAYLNRAQLYDLRGDFDHAIADYDTLIARDTEPGLYLYWIRSEVKLKAERCEEVIADLETIRQRPGVESDGEYLYILHTLGKAYLLCGESDSAEKTYQEMPPLTPDDVEYFSSDLGEFSANLPEEAKEVIARILTHILELKHE